jgi:branched-subunit amino acid aminotransferase/4-amino-4-deoxychorismate lyase
LSQRIEQLVAMNASFLPDDAEQGICFFATPGPLVAWNWPSGQASAEAVPVHAQPVFYAHSYPLPVGQWQSSYQQGIDLVTTQVRQVPQDCWPGDIKVRSRLHYYLAQKQSRSILNGSYPILLDEHGTVSDSAIGSILGYNDSQGLIVRKPLQRYASISLDYTIELAGNLGLNVTEYNFSVVELQSFDEAFLVSTPWCILPVATVDSRSLKNSGFSVFQRLMQAWSDRVGADILKV